jgi:hypothetical protein
MSLILNKYNENIKLEQIKIKIKITRLQYSNSKN